MALTYRFYRAVRVGDGTTPDTAFRSRLADFIVQDSTGANFWDWIHDARAVRYGLAYCDSTVHATLAADAQMTVMSPELTDLSAVQAWLDGTVAGAPQALRDQWEADGCSVAWCTAQTTKREAFRYLCRLCTLTQELRRLKDPDALDFFARLLTATVAQVPAATRTRVQTWMTGRGLDTSWIVGTTTVRAVIQFILDGATFPILRLGPVAL